MVDNGVIVHNRLGYMAVRSLGVFYADYGIIGSREPECLQGALEVLIGLFRRIGLAEMYLIPRLRFLDGRNQIGDNPVGV